MLYLVLFAICISILINFVNADDVDVDDEVFNCDDLQDDWELPPECFCENYPQDNCPESCNSKCGNETLNIQSDNQQNMFGLHFYPFQPFNFSSSFLRPSANYHTYNHDVGHRLSHRGRPRNNAKTSIKVEWFILFTIIGLNFMF
uniref:Uncharacterized protein n=1 Tax=Panagrolaimus sp. PS1159 TaxID=55785 RepID=A0AC35F4R7_9BILA